jgi:hypothetical protein
MSKREAKTIAAPRIEIVLYQSDDIKSRDEYGAALVCTCPMAVRPPSPS